SGKQVKPALTSQEFFFVIIFRVKIKKKFQCKRRDFVELSQIYAIAYFPQVKRVYCSVGYASRDKAEFAQFRFKSAKYLERKIGTAANAYTCSFKKAQGRVESDGQIVGEIR